MCSVKTNVVLSGFPLDNGHYISAEGTAKGKAEGRLLMLFELTYERQLPIPDAVKKPLNLVSRMKLTSGRGLHLLDMISREFKFIMLRSHLDLF